MAARILRCTAGHATSQQFQLDVYGEAMDTLHLARAAHLEPEPYTWRIQCGLLHFLELHWQDPDEGIWEVRRAAPPFHALKVMAWVAFDRAIEDIETFAWTAAASSAWREVREVRRRSRPRGMTRGATPSCSPMNRRISMPACC